MEVELSLNKVGSQTTLKRIMPRQKLTPSRSIRKEKLRPDSQLVVMIWLPHHRKYTWAKKIWHQPLPVASWRDGNLNKVIDGEHLTTQAHGAVPTTALTTVQSCRLRRHTGNRLGALLPTFKTAWWITLRETFNMPKRGGALGMTAPIRLGKQICAHAGNECLCDSKADMRHGKTTPPPWWKSP